MAESNRSDRLQGVRGRRKRTALIVAGIVVAVVALGVGAWALIALGMQGSPGAGTQSVRTIGGSLASSAPASAASAATSLPVEVPQVVGQTVQEAEVLLDAAGLSVSRTPTPQGEETSGAVLAQSPAAGQKVNPGANVDLVYADPAATQKAVTSVVAKTSVTAPTKTSATTQVQAIVPARGLVVCIDPGHQTHANLTKEPIGPGSTILKPKVTGGATGVATRQHEYALALALSMKVKARLARYGVTVVMTRSTNNVNIANSQRAAVANQARARLFVRIHADSSTNAAVNGISTLRPAGNAWVKPIEVPSYRAANIIQREMLLSTGARNRGVVGRSDLSGFNYSRVPAVLVEVGFLSNAVEDRKMATSAYQDKLADAIARGVLKYLGVIR